MRNSLTPTALNVLIFALGALVAAASVVEAEFEVEGAVEGRWLASEESHSWLEGGFGVLRIGGSPQDDSQMASGSAHISLRWQPSDHFRSHVHLLGAPSFGNHDSAVGVVEAFVELGFGDNTAGTGFDENPFRIRLGNAFLPTTFENVALLWRSPYTVTSSALTTWIGEEFRPTGLQVDYRHEVSPAWSWNVGGSLFGGADTSGALLAWRGWSLSDRVSIFGESIPLPSLPSLGPQGIFEPQRDDGTQPFGSDLDGELGWASWFGNQWSNGIAIQATLVDTRGDRGLHEGEYAWETDFAIIGGQLPIGRTGLLAAEWMWGSTGMQPGPQPRVQIDFSTWYLLANWQRGPWSWTLRWDDFENTDQARFPGVEPTDQSGDAWTLATGVTVGPVVGRLEWLEVTSERPGAAALTGTEATGGRQLSFELEFSW